MQWTQALGSGKPCVVCGWRRCLCSSCGSEPLSQGLVVSIGKKKKKKKERILFLRCSRDRKSKVKCGLFYLARRMLEQERATFGNWLFRVCRCIKFFLLGGSCHGTAETNPTRNHEVLGLIPGLSQWVKDLVLP